MHNAGGPPLGVLKVALPYGTNPRSSVFVLRLKSMSSGCASVELITGGCQRPRSAVLSSSPQFHVNFAVIPWCFSLNM